MNDNITKLNICNELINCKKNSLSWRRHTYRKRNKKTENNGNIVITGRNIITALREKKNWLSEHSARDEDAAKEWLKIGLKIKENQLKHTKNPRPGGIRARPSLETRWFPHGNKRKPETTQLEARKKSQIPARTREILIRFVVISFEAPHDASLTHALPLSRPSRPGGGRRGGASTPRWTPPGGTYGKDQENQEPATERWVQHGTVVVTLSPRNPRGP